jgi:hypothetical protein
LTLDSNITLEGLSDNNAALVMVHSGGALKMKDDSKISNNTISSGVGGGGVLLTTGTFVKGKHNEMAENTMREMLTAVPDRDFDKAVSQLYTVSNRYGLDLSAIKLAIANFGAMADDTPAGYVRGPGGGLIHLGTEAQCDCCGHHYLWSQMADEYLNAEKDWWGYCPVCGLNGDEQANAHRAIRRAGEIPEGYSAILDRLYQRYAERDFQPIKTRAEVKKALENRDRVHERLSVQAKLMELEQSYKDRVKKYKDKEMDREKYT